MSTLGRWDNNLLPNSDAQSERHSFVNLESEMFRTPTPQAASSDTDGGPTSDPCPVLTLATVRPHLRTTTRCQLFFEMEGQPSCSFTAFSQRFRSFSNPDMVSFFHTPPTRGQQQSPCCVCEYLPGGHPGTEDLRMDPIT